MDLLKETQPQSLNMHQSSESEKELSSVNYPIHRAKFGGFLALIILRKYF